MAAYFFDSSALAKAYHVEVGSDRVARLLLEPGAQFLISSLTAVELQSAFAQKLRGGIATMPEYRQLRRKFGGDLRKKRLIVKGLFRRHQHAAENLIVKHAPTKRLRTLDALQLAVALELALGGAADHFVVADQLLAQIAASEGLSVINPNVP